MKTPELTTEAQRHRGAREESCSLCLCSENVRKKKNVTQRRGDAERKQGMLFSAPLRLCVRLNETCIFMLWGELKTHERLW
jgi:hypothetical protein